MADEGFKSGPSAGGKCGCAAAAIVAVPLLFFLTLAETLGDCVPGRECHKGFVLLVFAPTVMTASALFLAIRALVNRFRRRLDGIGRTPSSE